MISNIKHKYGLEFCHIFFPHRILIEQFHRPRTLLLEDSRKKLLFHFKKINFYATTYAIFIFIGFGFHLFDGGM
jgi:hypothetical protein